MSGDGVSEKQFYDALRALEKTLSDKIDERANQIEQKLDDHAADDLKVANRVLVIETQRSDEQAQAIRRGAWAGIGAAGGVSVLIKGIEHWFKP